MKIIERVNKRTVFGVRFKCNMCGSTIEYEPKEIDYFVDGKDIWSAIEDGSLDVPVRLRCTVCGTRDKYYRFDLKNVRYQEDIPEDGV